MSANEIVRRMILMLLPVCQMNDEYVDKCKNAVKSGVSDQNRLVEIYRMTNVIYNKYYQFNELKGAVPTIDLGSWLLGHNFVLMQPRRKILLKRRTL